MQTAIKVEQLSKSYGNLLAIDQISLSVKYGTVYGLLAFIFGKLVADYGIYVKHWSVSRRYC